MTWFTSIEYSLESFKNVSRWALSSEFFDKPIRGKCVGDCQTYLEFLSQTTVFLESGFLPLHVYVRESHFGKTYICINTCGESF